MFTYDPTLYETYRNHPLVLKAATAAFKRILEGGLSPEEIVECREQLLGAACEVVTLQESFLIMK